ncbi:hypothetical protein ACH5RR_002852 [Cinchona calisaya]|uniref:Chromo domain-containing protein n=1 Tax=Cinchona calisaya TaxID=153742 RepID=A0ABD3AT61_9GENT
MQSYEQDRVAQEHISELLLKPGDVTEWQYLNGLFKYKERIYIGEPGEIKGEVGKNPMAILARQTDKWGKVVGVQWLVQWEMNNEENATWE